MEAYTQLGIAGLTLGILFFIVRYFISALDKKDGTISGLTDRFIKVTEDTNQSHAELTTAIGMNTKVTKESVEASKKSSDNLTKLVLKIVKTK